MIVGSLEAELLDVYGDPGLMEAVQDQNEGLENMSDPRQKVGWGWWALGAVGMVASLGVAIKRPVLGTAMIAVTATNLVHLGVRRVGKGLPHAWSRAWRY